MRNPLVARLLGPRRVLPMSPDQVREHNERARASRVRLLRSYIVSATLAAALLAWVFARAGDTLPAAFMPMAMGVAACHVSALWLSFRGRHAVAAVLTLTVATVALVWFVSVVSAALSFESYLFGLAVMAFVLVPVEVQQVRAPLGVAIIGAYMLAELVWPDGTAQVVVESELATMLALFNRMGAGVLLIFAVIEVERRHRRVQMVTAAAAAYGELRATTDELTGLANRRPVLERLDQWSAEGNRDFAIAILDLDNFKDINDDAGHACGDAVLVAVAARLRDSARPGDVVSRWGGDEFLILMDGVKQVDVAGILERFRAGVEGIDCGAQATGHAVTASIGAAVGCERLTVDECIAAADRALYRAKEAGRNRVVATTLAG